MNDLITSVRVKHGAPGGHDLVRIWNRGGLAGELVVSAGDGAKVGDRLMHDPDEPARVVDVACLGEETRFTWHEESAERRGTEAA